MSKLMVSPEYSALLRKVPPRIIRAERENEAYSQILHDLERRSKMLSLAERRLGGAIDTVD